MSLQDTEQQPLRDEKLLRLAPPEIRAGFISKVYGILAVQLLVTAGVAAPFVLLKGLQDFIQGSGFALLVVVMVLNIAFLCVMSCCQDTMRKFPTNYILLGGFTVTEGMLVGVICTQYKLDVIVAAVVATALLVVGLTMYAMYTKRDFTGFGPYLFAGCLVMCVFGLFLAFLHCPIAQKIYCCLGILLFSFYLIYDTQLIMGKGELALSIDDYCFGALQLYIDIIQLFIYILQLMGKRD